MPTNAIATTELAVAAYIAVLGLVQIMLTARVYRRDHGLKYANTARDVPSSKADSVLLGRLSRAEGNLLATAPYFFALVMVVGLAGLSSPITQICALIYGAMRTAYLPLYMAGVPWLRGLVWTVSYAALLVMGVAVLLGLDWGGVFGVGH